MIKELSASLIIRTHIVLNIGWKHDKTRCVSHDGPATCIVSSMGMHVHWKMTYFGKKKNTCPLLITVKEKNDVSIFQSLNQLGFIIHNCELWTLMTYCIVLFQLSTLFKLFKTQFLFSFRIHNCESVGSNDIALWYFNFELCSNCEKHCFWSWSFLHNFFFFFSVLNCRCANYDWI
jgi:hypothetical protein